MTRMTMAEVASNPDEPLLPLLFHFRLGQRFQPRLLLRPELGHALLRCTLGIFLEAGSFGLHLLKTAGHRSRRGERQCARAGRGPRRTRGSRWH